AGIQAAGHGSRAQVLEDGIELTDCDAAKLARAAGAALRGAAFALALLDRNDDARRPPPALDQGAEHSLDLDAGRALHHRDHLHRTIHRKPPGPDPTCVAA